MLDEMANAATQGYYRTVSQSVKSQSVRQRYHMNARAKGASQRAGQASCVVRRAKSETPYEGSWVLPGDRDDILVMV